MSPGARHALDSSVLVLNKLYMAVHVISELCQNPSMVIERN